MKLFSIMDTAFENFDETVRTYLGKSLGLLGMQYSDNLIFGIIFDGIKGIMQNIMFYIEDAFTEQNIYTAQRKKSIYSLARLSGYLPYYGAAATGTLLGSSIVSLPLPSGATKIYIPNGIEVRNEATGIKYMVYMPTDYYVIDITKPLVTHEFKIIQGSWTNARFVAEGYGLETFTLDNMTLFDKDYIEVKVNGEKWTQAGCLYDMSNNQKEYIASPGYDNSLEIMFGTGAYGKILQAGDTITIRYLTHSGKMGNVSPTESSAWVFEGFGADSYGNAVDINNYMLLTINNYVTGGTNADSLSIVRSMVGYSSRSLVLANYLNFELFLRRFSFISYVNIWSQKNSMTLTACCLSNNYTNYGSASEYFNADLNDMFLSTDQKEMIIATLNNSGLVFAGVTLNFIDPILRKYAIIVYVKTDSIQSSRDSIKSDITNTLGDYFKDLGMNTSFISRSELLSMVNNCNANIKSCDLYIISELAESTYEDGYYYKYELQFDKGVYSYKTTKVLYEPDSYPGLDNFGNIQLDNEMEIPVLRGGWIYHADKGGDEENTITLENVSVYFSN